MTKGYIEPRLPKYNRDDPDSVVCWTEKAEKPGGAGLDRHDFMNVDEAGERISEIYETAEPLADADTIGPNHWTEVAGKLHGDSKQALTPDLDTDDGVETSIEAVDTDTPEAPPVEYQPDSDLQKETADLQQQWNALEAQYRSINWEQAHQQDKARAFALHHQMQDDARNLQLRFVENVHARQDKAKKSLDQVFASDEWANAPEWNDSERRRLAQYLLQMGVSREQLMLETNPVFYIEARRALLQRDGHRPKSRKKLRIVTKAQKAKKAEQEKVSERLKAKNIRPQGFHAQVEKISEILNR